MASQKLNLLAMSATRLMCQRMMSSTGKVESVAQTKQSIDLANFDPNNYNIPVRPVTMDDTMEPYGPWKVAYAAEKKRANRMLLLGIMSFTSACLVVYYGGVFDGVIMPNLDNIMEETEPANYPKDESRISV